MQSTSYSIADIEAFASRFYQGRALLITPYAYTITFTALAAATTASQVINIAMLITWLAVVAAANAVNVIV
jgi:hypothetical protein